MARFAAAKMNGAIDVRFQRFYNDLIDLLDTGYIVETTLDSHKFKISITAKDGVVITSDGKTVLGLDSSGAAFVTKLAYVDNPESKYGIIGDFPGVGYGLALYDTDVQSDPFFSVRAVQDHLGVFQGSFIYDQDGTPRIGLLGSTGIAILDGNGNYTISLGDSYAKIAPSTGKATLFLSQITGIEMSWDSTSRLSIDGTETYLRSPDGTNEIMVNNTAAYINNSLIWHGGNDGALSGLDADKLDGEHASYYTTAEAVTTATLENGWINQSVGTYGSVKYYKDKDRVFFHAVLNGTSATADTITTLPVGYRPAVNQLLVSWNITGSVAFMLIVNSSGTITTTLRGIIAISVSFRI